MPKPLADGLPSSRHSYEEVVDEIRHALGDKKRGGGRGAHKQAAAACLLEPDQFAKRLRGLPTPRFEVEHFGAIADYLHAPKGWPLIPWELAESMADALKKRPRK
jgi:hypothetical protein